MSKIAIAPAIKLTETTNGENGADWMHRFAFATAPKIRSADTRQMKRLIDTQHAQRAIDKINLVETARVLGNPPIG